MIPKSVSSDEMTGSGSLAVELQVYQIGLCISLLFIQAKFRLSLIFNCSI